MGMGQGGNAVLRLVLIGYLFLSAVCISRPFSFTSTVVIPNGIEAGEKITGEPFEAEGSSWQLVVYPRGDRVAKRLGFCSVYLECLSETDKDVCFEISLLGAGEGEKTVQVEKKSCSKHNFSKLFNPYGFMKFVDAKTLFESKYACRDDGGAARFRCAVGPPGAALAPAAAKERPATAGARAGAGAARRRRAGGPPAGLVNPGNICYMNAVLQALRHLPAFAGLFAEDGGPGRGGPVARALAQTFASLAGGRGGAGSAAPLVRATGADPRVQQDAHEFNRLLMAAVEAEAEAEEGGGGAAAGVQNLFSGYLASYLRCTSVPHERVREEPFYDVSLDVAGVGSVQEALARFVEPELLSGDNQWKTPNHGKQDALKGQSFLALPPVLQLHLKRFEYDYRTGRMSKLNDRVTFNTKLDMAPYLADGGQGEGEGGQQHRYALHAVVVHVGAAADAGHYYAYVRPSASGNQWYRLDDSRVTEVSKKQVMEDAFGGGKKSLFRRKHQSSGGTKSAYLLQYVRECDRSWVLEEDIE